MTASPGEPPSVTSGLKVLAHPIKPASPIRLLFKQQPKISVFSAHAIFTTFCASFFQ